MIYIRQIIELIIDDYIYEKFNLEYEDYSYSFEGGSFIFI